MQSVHVAAAVEFVETAKQLKLKKVLIRADELNKQNTHLYRQESLFSVFVMTGQLTVTLATVILILQS